MPTSSSPAARGLPRRGDLGTGQPGGQPGSRVVSAARSRTDPSNNGVTSVRARHSNSQPDNKLSECRTGVTESVGPLGRSVGCWSAQRNPQEMASGRSPACKGLARNPRNRGHLAADGAFSILTAETRSLRVGTRSPPVYTSRRAFRPTSDPALRPLRPHPASWWPWVRLVMGHRSPTAS